MFACTMVTLCALKLTRPFPAPLVPQPVCKNTCREESVRGDNGWSTRPCYPNEWWKETSHGILLIRILKDGTQYAFTGTCPNDSTRSFIYVWGYRAHVLIRGCGKNTPPRPSTDSIGKPPTTSWYATPTPEPLKVEQSPTADGTVDETTEDTP
jgi:hypothetical protein